MRYQLKAAKNLAPLIHYVWVIEIPRNAVKVT